MTHPNLESSLRKHSAEGGLAAMIVRPVATGRIGQTKKARRRITLAGQAAPRRI